MAFLKSISPEQLLFYGELDDKIYPALKRFPHTIINEGSRFANNIEIVKDYVNRTNAEQVILTNGRFIESELIHGGYGKEPVLFIGEKETPEEVISFLKDSDFKVNPSYSECPVI